MTVEELIDAPAKPLIYCARSILAWERGAKTQTRRLVKPLPMTDNWELSQNDDGHWAWIAASGYAKGMELQPVRQPYAVGDLLWIREALVRWHGWVAYSADHDYADGAHNDPQHHLFVSWASTRWKRNKLPAIFMPHWACRYYARVVNVRPERLQQISVQDALAEGTLAGLSCTQIKNWYCDKAPLYYYGWWDSMHSKPGTRSEDNPWVWVYGLEVADGSKA